MLPQKRIRSQNNSISTTSYKVLKYSETQSKSTLITKLPSHILMQIFNFLNQTILTTVISRACKTFNYILKNYPGLITHYELDVWESNNPRCIKIKPASIKKLSSYNNIDKISFQYQIVTEKNIGLKEINIPKLLENVWNCSNIMVFYSKIPANSEDFIMELLDNLTSLKVLKLGLIDSSAIFISFIIGNILLSRRILEVFNIAYLKKPIIHFGVDEELDFCDLNTRKIPTYDLFRNNRNLHNRITINTDFSRLRTLKFPHFLAFSKEDALLFCNILIKIESTLENLQINSSILYALEFFLMFIERNQKLRVLILDISHGRVEKFMTIDTILELNNAVSTTNIRKYKIPSREKIFHTGSDDMEDDFFFKTESSGTKFITSINDLLQHSCVESLILEMPELSESVKAHLTDTIIYYIKKGKLINFNGYRIKNIHDDIKKSILLQLKKKQYYESALFYQVFMHIISEQIPEILSSYNKNIVLSELCFSFIREFENSYTISFTESQDINIKVLYLALVLFKPNLLNCEFQSETPKTFIETSGVNVKKSLNPIDYNKTYSSVNINTLSIDINFSTFFLFIIPSTLPFYKNLKSFIITLPELKERQAIFTNNLLSTCLLQMHSLSNLTIISGYTIKGIESTINILMTFKSLKTLTLNNISFTDNIIIGENLKKLDFSYCSFTDEKFINLAESIKLNKEIVSLKMMDIVIIYEKDVFENLICFILFLNQLKGKEGLEEISLRIVDSDKRPFRVPNVFFKKIMVSIKALLNNNPKLRVLNLIFPISQNYLMNYFELILGYLMNNSALEVFNYINLKENYLKVLYEQFTNLYNNEQILDISSYTRLKNSKLKYAFYGTISIISFLVIFSLIRAQGLDNEIRKIALDKGIITEKSSKYKKLQIKNLNHCKKLTFHYICLQLFQNIEKLVLYQTNFLHIDNEILKSCFSQMLHLTTLKLNKIITKNLDFSILLIPPSLNHLIFKNMIIEKIKLSAFSQYLNTKNISSLSFKNIRRSKKLEHRFNVMNFFNSISFPTLKNLHLDFCIFPEEMLSALGVINTLSLTYLSLQVINNWDKFKLPIHLISKFLGNLDGKLKIFQVSDYVWNMPLIIEKLPILSFKDQVLGIMDVTILESLISKDEVSWVNRLEIKLSENVLENNSLEIRRIFGNEKIHEIEVVADFESEVLKELKEEFREKIVGSG
ncbi:hypothetical protein SteCoe_29257 [Stentor coeruleus]|uniref:F-box domain-containing protein n=1 Tax=Stentor coeruleus TaxID=5963 RepID=A0A1R2B6E3_9CILI|nr:hypothetical protein SteCoe_29257 [Stentor coeruleus]